MKQSRRRLLAAVLLCCTTVASAAAAYPDHSVHFIVPFSPGGVTDLLARILAQKLAEKWGQPVIVENRPGGNGTVADGLVARASPDGYTVIIVITSHTVAPSDSQYKLSYDPVGGFSPITLLGFTPELLVVNPKVLDVTSVPALIAEARAHPGSINFGSAGSYTPGFLNMALLMHAAGVDMVNVNYMGSGPVLTALLGGEVQVTFSTMDEALAQVRAGKLRALAVSGSTRSPLTPELPTVLQAVGKVTPEQAAMLGADTAWYGALAPGGTPSAIVDRLHDDMVAVLQTPDVQQRLAAQSFVVDGRSPGDFGTFIQHDIGQWIALRKAGVLH